MEHNRGHLAGNLAIFGSLGGPGPQSHPDQLHPSRWRPRGVVTTRPPTDRGAIDQPKTESPGPDRATSPIQTTPSENRSAFQIGARALVSSMA